MEINLKELEGLTKADALVKLGFLGFKARIREEDGEIFMGTADYRTDRVNLYITAGLVTKQP